MPHRDRSSFIAALERLGSAADADALAAAREVHERVAGAGLAWADFLAELPDDDGFEPARAAAPAGPLPEADDALLAWLLARADLSTETRAELVDLQRELSGGALADMDRQYVRALARRLAG